MNRRRLGRTNLMVSEFCFGTYNITAEFGVPRDGALAVLRHAFSHGINFVDTAQLYGGGESEELVGRVVSEFPEKDIIISSKVGHLYRGIVQHGGDAAYQDEDLLLRTVEHSLYTLRKDRIDLFMIHEPDWPVWGIDINTGNAPVLNVLERLKRDGVIKYIGLGGTNNDNMVDLVETGRFDVFLIAFCYNLVTQIARDRLIPAAKKHDVGVIIAAPFRQGVMVKKRDVKELESEGLDEKTIHRIKAVYDISDETGISLTDLSLRYLISDPDIACIATGVQTVFQLESNMQAIEAGPLPAELLDRLDKAGR